MMRAIVLPILAPFLFVRNWAIALTGMLLWEHAEEKERQRQERARLEAR